MTDGPFDLAGIRPQLAEGCEHCKGFVGATQQIFEADLQGATFQHSDVATCLINILLPKAKR